MSIQSIPPTPDKIQAVSHPQVFAPGLLPEEEKEFVDPFWHDGSGELDEVYGVQVCFTPEEDPIPTLAKLRAMGYTINSIEVLIGPIDSYKEGEDFADRLSEMGLFVSSPITTSLVHRKGQSPLPPEWRKRLDNYRSHVLKVRRELEEQREKVREEWAKKITIKATPRIGNVIPFPLAA